MCTVGIFPWHTERTYVPKLGSKLFVFCWFKHLSTYVALVMGKDNGRLASPNLLTDALRASLSSGWRWIMIWKAMEALPLLKQGVPTEVQFWAQVGVPGHLPCPAGGTILV